MSNSSMEWEGLRQALTLLTNFAARQVHLRYEGQPLEGNVTDKENEFLQLIDKYTAQREAEVVDKWVAELLENIYPLDVFHRTTTEDKERLNKYDSTLHSMAHIDGIYHGMHILRREVRQLSARDDLEPLPQETEAYYAALKQGETQL